MKNSLLISYVGPQRVTSVGRLNGSGTLRCVVARSWSLSFASKLSGLAVTKGAVTSASTAPKPFSDKWCKEKKIEILKAGLPAVFEDMSMVKQSDYFAITRFRDNPLSFYSLNNVAGIYMITNKVTKKYYIGMTSSIKSRLYNYLYVDRLINNSSSRINKALLKFGYSNFSFSILEFSATKDSSILREREDFFIRIFKPQYNIARNSFNLDKQNEDSSRSYSMTLVIPLKIKYLLDKALNPAELNWNLISFSFNKMRSYYSIICITPKAVVHANSSGWFEGVINKKTGYEVFKNKKNQEVLSIDSILKAQGLIDKERLASFYTKEKSDFVDKQLKEKAKALKKLVP